MKTCHICAYSGTYGFFVKKSDPVLCKHCAKEAKKALKIKNFVNTHDSCSQHKCTQPILPGKTYCRYHSVYARLSHLNLYSFTEAILQRLDNNPYCPYTGEFLELGVNAALDHILPVSRFPQFKNDPDNLEWISNTANRAKWNMTKDEFLAAYKIIKL